MEVLLFTTIQVAIEIGRGSKMLKDHTGILGDWMMSNPCLITMLIRMKKLRKLDRNVCIEVKKLDWIG